MRPEDVLASGHYSLRFPPELEARFDEHTRHGRRMTLLVCALIGAVAVIIGSLNLLKIAPDLGYLGWQMVGAWMLTTTLGLLAFWFAPEHLQRSWHGEALTLVQATSIGLAIDWIAQASTYDTAVAHSMTAAMPVVYCCIAARQRFYWSLTAAIISLLGYVLIVKGDTPMQVDIIHSVICLMILSYALGLAANYALEHRERRNWLLHIIEQRHRQDLLDASVKLEQLSLQDPLTGLANRRHFDQAMSEAWERAATRRTTFSLLMIDVDHFKAYNDAHGHPAGDACLKQIARILQDNVRVPDAIVARLGGEEFCVLLPGLNAVQARRLGEHIRQEVWRACMPHRDSPVEPVVTVSMGVAERSAHQLHNTRRLLERADNALYDAKMLGRHRVEVAPADDPDEPQELSRPMSLGTPSMFAPEEPPLAPTAEHEARKAYLLGVFKRQFTWLRFPRGLEQAYAEQQIGIRRLQLALTVGFGLLTFNLFVLLNGHMFPDIADLVLKTQFLVTTLMGGLTVAAHLAPISVRQRDAVFAFGVSVIGGASAAVLAQSQLTSAMAFSVCLSLIPLFAGVAARQPFWHTCLTTLSTTATAAILLTPRSEAQSLIYIDVIFTIVGNSLFTLMFAYTIERGRRRAWLLSQIDELQARELDATTARLQALSTVDPLTGINNRRQFEADFSRIWSEGLHSQRPVAMLIIDIDHFKQYNDHYGHPQGDRCLKRVATLIQQCARAERALAARLGGEEFGVLLPDARTDKAMRLAERVCRAIRDAGIEHKLAPTGHVTVSVGAAHLARRIDQDRMLLFSLADEGLYEAKHGGRDRVATSRQDAAPQPRQQAQTMPA